MSNSGYTCSWVGRDADAGRDTDDVSADSGGGCWVLDSWDRGRVGVGNGNLSDEGS